MRKWLIVLMAAVAIGATGILGWLYMRQDRKGPEITEIYRRMSEARNPYGDGTASIKIRKILENIDA